MLYAIKNTFSFTKKGAFFIIKLSPSPAEAVDAQASNGLREALEDGGKCPFISMDSGIPGGFWNNPSGFRGMPLSRNEKLHKFKGGGKRRKAINTAI